MKENLVWQPLAHHALCLTPGWPCQACILKGLLHLHAEQLDKGLKCFVCAYEFARDQAEELAILSSAL